mgnify:CR=1 FL=1
MALLEARELTVSYGGLHANESINLNCEEGKLVGLISTMDIVRALAESEG